MRDDSERIWPYKFKLPTLELNRRVRAWGNLVETNSESRAI